MTGIDVIVPCYNYGRFLTECIKSVLRQPVPDIRVLIVDDASSDGTAEVAAEIAREDRRVGWLRHPVNRGHITTYNEGLEWAEADHTLLLSADDMVLPGALWRATTFLEAHPEAGFVYGPFVVFEDAQRVENIPPTSLEPRGTVLSGSQFLRLNRHFNPVHTSTAVVRTGLQKALGGYRHELPHAGDVEMWMRFAAHASVGRLESYQGAARRHGQNMSDAYYRDILLDVRQRKAAYDAFFQHHGNLIPDGSDVKRCLDRGLAGSALRMASQPLSRGDTEGFKALLAFALDLDPDVRQSLVWKLQACKRMIGPSAWASIRPIARPFIDFLIRRAKVLAPTGFHEADE
jgi:hypothetical protein